MTDKCAPQTRQFKEKERKFLMQFYENYCTVVYPEPITYVI